MATATRERPILFGGPMVRAILDDRKGQTRRVMKPQPQENFSADYRDGEMVRRRSYGTVWQPSADSGWYNLEHPLILDACPYGRPGDRLWVRESAYIAPPNFGDPSDANARDYDGRPRVVGYAASMNGEAVRCATDYGVKQTPSIHMPHWASRLTLEITEVRVERLQAISEVDAIAEGLEAQMGDGLTPAVCAFRHLWDRLNARRGFRWETDPFVWAISFKRVDRPCRATIHPTGTGSAAAVRSTRARTCRANPASTAATRT